MRKTILLLLMIMLLCLTACQKDIPPETTVPTTQAVENINISEYLVYEEVGFDGFGKLDVQLDNDKLLADLIPYIKNFEMNKEDVVNYCVTYLQNYQILKIEYDTSETLKNGDIVEMHLTKTDYIDELCSYFNVVFDINDVKHTIKLLNPTQTYNPFDDMTMEISGLDGEGVASFTIKHESEDGTWSYNVISDVELENLHNGDVINLTIGEGTISDEDMHKNFGLIVEYGTYQHTVNELIYKPHDTVIFECFDEKTKKTFDEVIKDWVIDGLNDENQGKHKRTAELYDLVLMTNEENIKLFAIYHIDDGFVENGYFVYISPTKDLLIDPVKKEILDSECKKLTSSFIYYDKETIRYTEKFKWGQDYERHGFMYKDVPYAGKLTFEEELQYLIECYPEFKEYEMRGA